MFNSKFILNSFDSFVIPCTENESQKGLVERRFILFQIAKNLEDLGSHVVFVYGLRYYQQ